MNAIDGPSEESATKVLRTQPIVESAALSGDAVYKISGLDSTAFASQGRVSVTSINSLVFSGLQPTSR